MNFIFQYQEHTDTEHPVFSTVPPPCAFMKFRVRLHYSPELYVTHYPQTSVPSYFREDEIRHHFGSVSSNKK
jgi:hypothetical protein